MEAIIGSSVSIDDGKGGSFLVPLGAAENKIANQVLASQMRHMIQEHIKVFRDKDTTLTPKELRDLAEAAKSVAQFSGEVYVGNESLITKPEMKSAIPSEKPDDAINFDDLTKPKEPAAQ